MKKTIKQQIIDHLESGSTLTYGQANTITNSQSGYRRFQEILKDNPDKYRYVRVKSDNGGYYNVFGLPKSFYTIVQQNKCVSLIGRQRLIDKFIKYFATQKEAKAHIKKVIR